MGKLYNVGAYIRLSMEDASYDSDSVENQQDMLTQFAARMPGWILHKCYIDNGVSGGSFDRPAFLELMEDVRRGRINLFLVKDLSRFGRNYLEAGRYLEEELPALGCRFVALADGVDTDDGENDIVPFLNIINDFHIKSHSERIRSVMAAKARDGQKISGHAPYGYRRNPEDHTRLIVDDYAAGIVRKIFHMRSQGAGYGKIVQTLNGDDILPPLLYYLTSSEKDASHIKTRLWRVSTLREMLRKEIYIGNAEQLVKKVVSYRDKREVKRPQNEWARVENAFPAIIDRDTWERVQCVNREISTKFVDRSAPRNHLFKDRLTCADCGSPLYGITFSHKKKEGKSIYVAYVCGAWHMTSGGTCSRHGISEAVLEKLLLEDIRRHSDRVALDEDAVLQELLSRLCINGDIDQKERKREVRALRERLHRLDVLYEQLYEDRVMGVISEDNFYAMQAKYESERIGKENRLALLTQTEDELSAKLADIQKWMGLIREQSCTAKLDRDLLDTLVEKIVVGESKTENGQKYQDIRIHYRFVGLIEATS